MTTNKYEIIFNNAPIGIWEEDWSGIKNILCNLKEIVPANEFEEYLNNNPNLVKKLLNSIKIIRVNKKAVEMHEASSELELINTPVINTFVESSIEAFKQEMISLYCGGKEFEMETDIKTLKGNIINVIIKVELPNESSYNNVIIVMTDTTKNNEINNKYIKTQAKFHKSFYQGVVGMIVTDIDGKILEINNAFCDLTKYPIFELKYTNVENILDDKDLIKKDMLDLKSNNQIDYSLKGERQILDKLNNKIWVYMGISMVRDELDNPIYFVIQAVDINSEKKISLTMENNVHKYKQLLESTNAIHLVLNENSDIMEYSESFANLLEVVKKNNSLEKRPLRSLISTESIPSYDLAWKNIMEGKTVTNVEISLSKGTTFKWVSMNASMFKNGHQKIFVLLTDISQKKRKELEKLIKTEKNRDKLKNNIMSLRKKIKNYGKNENVV